MSRIGKKPVTIPSGVSVELTATQVKAKGPQGELSMNIPDSVIVKHEGNEIIVEKKNNSARSREQWGLGRTLVNNLVNGVHTKFKKELELQGVGYKYNIAGNKITLNLGYSHPIDLNFPEGVSVEEEKDKKGILIITGVDKAAVGQFAAKIRGLRPVEPYKGKGFRYVGERVIRKAGKAAAK